MALLIAGLVLFLGTHSVSIIARPWRDAMFERLGEGPWKGLYSLASLAGFVLIVVGYGAARTEPTLLYAPPTFLRHIALLMLLPVFPLLMATYLPGRIQTFARKHPMLLATRLWAVAHLMANGMLHEVVLFGSILVWAGLDQVSLKKRNAPSPPGAPPGRWNDAIALGLGLAGYVVFVLWAHEWVTGVSPVGG